jgi:hypothetical protein
MKERLQKIQEIKTLTILYQVKTNNHYLVAGRDKLTPLIKNSALSDAVIAIGLTLKILL